MKKQCRLSFYHILIYQLNAPLIYDYSFFYIRFEVISYDYNKLYNSLEHLVIDLLVVKERILFGVNCSIGTNRIVEQAYWYVGKRLLMVKVVYIIVFLSIIIVRLHTITYHLVWFHIKVPINNNFKIYFAIKFTIFCNLTF